MLDCMCQQALGLRRYLLHICIFVCVCLYMDIVRNHWMSIVDKQEPSTSQRLQHQICIDLFCCSWNLSLPLDVIVSIELTVYSVHFFLFFSFFVFWLHWTRKSWTCSVLLWTNIIQAKSDFEWILLHKWFRSLSHHHHHHLFFSSFIHFSSIAPILLLHLEQLGMRVCMFFDFKWKMRIE